MELKSLKIDPYIYGKMIFAKDVKAKKKKIFFPWAGWGLKNNLFSKSVLTPEHLYAKIIHLDLYPMLDTNFTLNCTIDINVKGKIINILGENIGENYCDLILN